MEVKSGFGLKIVKCEAEVVPGDKIQKLDSAFAKIAEQHETFLDRNSEAFSEASEDHGGNSELGGETSSSDDYHHGYADSGVATSTPGAISRGSTPTVSTPARSLRDTRNRRKRTADKMSGHDRTLAEAYIVSTNGNRRESKPAFATFIVAIEGRALSTDRIVESRPNIEHETAKMTTKLAEVPERPHIHPHTDFYTPPEDFVPGSEAAADWIGRMKYKYKWKKESFVKCMQEHQNILQTLPQSQEVESLTGHQQMKEARWMNDCKRMRQDIEAFDESFPRYLSAHETAIRRERDELERRRSQDRQDHMAFCLSILQSHYEQHTVGSGDKIREWEDGFRFCDGESPWYHPEIAVELNMDFAIDGTRPNTPMDHGDDMLVGELESLMSNMGIGV